VEVKLGSQDQGVQRLVAFNSRASEPTFLARLELHSQYLDMRSSITFSIIFKLDFILTSHLFNSVTQLGSLYVEPSILELQED
jgi:hypothetical protein